MDDVTVALPGARAYPIHVRDTFAALRPLLEALLDGRRAIVVLDGMVEAVTAGGARKAFQDVPGVVSVASLPPGEGTKSLAGYRRLLAALEGAALDRNGVVVAVGGGVTLDVAGFAAATHQRGVAWVACPTTLLAMVDAAIGGKTGLNFGGRKNRIGAFHQPLAVLTDVSRLETLPDREFRSGLAELVKSAIIADAPLFEALESQAGSLAARRGADMGALIAAAARVKADIVARDEREGGERAKLNFGHTIGHALEAATAFDRWTHGEAVAIGMRAATALSVRVAGLPPEEAARIEALLSALGLPAADPEAPLSSVVAALAGDKKQREGAPRFVLTPRIGSATFDHLVPQIYVNEVLTRVLGGASA